MYAVLPTTRIQVGSYESSDGPRPKMDRSRTRAWIWPETLPLASERTLTSSAYLNPGAMSWRALPVTLCSTPPFERAALADGAIVGASVMVGVLHATKPK